MDKMIKRRAESIFPGHYTTNKTTCTQSRATSSITEQTVCGFPVSQNIFDQLTVKESHTREFENEMNLITENEEWSALIDYIANRAQTFQSKTSISVDPVAEPSTLVQNIAELSVSVQDVTEQATGSEISASAL